MIEDGCTNITVQNCSFHADTSTVGVGRNGILIYGTTANTDILIDGCTMYDIPHTGISNNVNCSSSDTYIIRNCTIYSNDSHGISVKKGTIEIYDNVIYDAGGQGPRNNDRKGIRVTADATADVYNNVVYDCTGSGIGITSDVDTVNVW
ncbi:MAG: right-handed parallel beta-helix repeat-containing protein, partial [Planctomycetota bacterium]